MKKPIYIEETTLLRLKEKSLELERQGLRQTLGELATEAINASLNNNTVSRKSSHGTRNSCSKTAN